LPGSSFSVLLNQCGLVVNPGEGVILFSPGFLTQQPVECEMCADAPVQAPEGSHAATVPRITPVQMPPMAPVMMSIGFIVLGPPESDRVGRQSG
jgi:hypothetical protein